MWNSWFSWFAILILLSLFCWYVFNYLFCFSKGQSPMKTIFIWNVLHFASVHTYISANAHIYMLRHGQWMKMALFSAAVGRSLGILQREKDNCLVILHTSNTCQRVWCENQIHQILRALRLRKKKMKKLMTKKSESCMCEKFAHVETQRYVWAYKVLEIQCQRLDPCYALVRNALLFS